MNGKKQQYCTAPRCSMRVNTVRHFFKFPKERDRWLRWVHACGRLDLLDKGPEYANRNCRLCHLHFENKWYNVNKIRAHLHPDAIPTIFFGPGCEQQNKITVENKEENAVAEKLHLLQVKDRKSNDMTRNMSTDGSKNENTVAKKLLLLQVKDVKLNDTSRNITPDGNKKENTVPKKILLLQVKDIELKDITRNMTVDGSKNENAVAKKLFMMQAKDIKLDSMTRNVTTDENKKENTVTKKLVLLQAKDIKCNNITRNIITVVNKKENKVIKKLVLFQAKNIKLNKITRDITTVENKKENAVVKKLNGNTCTKVSMQIQDKNSNAESSKVTSPIGVNEIEAAKPSTSTNKCINSKKPLPDDPIIRKLLLKNQKLRAQKKSLREMLRQLRIKRRKEKNYLKEILRAIN